MECLQTKQEEQPTIAVVKPLKASITNTIMADTASADQKGLYCSTSGTFFTDKDALADHYKSDFHRYA